jgi:hypothetical protein
MKLFQFHPNPSKIPSELDHIPISVSKGINHHSLIHHSQVKTNVEHVHITNYTKSWYQDVC